jgi:hypothetical protein
MVYWETSVTGIDRSFQPESSPHLIRPDPLDMDLIPLIGDLLNANEKIHF